MSSVYVKYVKPIDINQVKIEMMEMMDGYRNQQYLFNMIKPTLTEFAGKKVNQRLITKLKKTFPQFHCYLKWVGSTMCHLEIKWATDKPPYKPKAELSLYLGHIGAYSWKQSNDDSGKGYYTMEMISDGNRWLYNIDDILNSMLRGAKILDENIKEWNKHLFELQKIYDRVEKFEGTSRYFKLEN